MLSNLEEAALRLVVEGTVSETGTGFFRALVKNLAKVMGTAGAWVTEYLPQQQRLRAHAFWLKGEFVENFEYNIAGTACAAAVEDKKLVHIPDRLLELYPGVPDLRALNAVSYLGVPLLDTESRVIGHLGVLDTKPLPANPLLISLFEIFAARAAAESRRLKVEQQVRAREQELSALLDSAMDSILVLDAGMKIARVNPAAERLLGCTQEDLIGESLNDFLVPESASRVEAFTKEIGGRPEGRQQLWVPQDFIARRWDHSVFPAEGTLSRFENRNEIFYTLILRNSDERLEAERQIRFLMQETEFLREAVREMPGHNDLLGRSDVMQAVFADIKRVAKTDSTVLITGETGTGGHSGEPDRK
jgi:PAS domain S-box-containing protein